MNKVFDRRQSLFDMLEILNVATNESEKQTIFVSLKDDTNIYLLVSI